MGLPKTKFHCPFCQRLRETRCGMCVECGNLIGCTAFSHDESSPFRGCGDNGVLVTEILRLTRERKNLISSLKQIMNFEVGTSTEFDYRRSGIIRDIKQLAWNTLRDYEDQGDK